MTLKNHLFLLSVIFSAPLLAIEDDDFWLLLAEPADSSIYVNSIQDSNGSLSFGVQLNQRLNDRVHVNASWSKLNFDENIRSRSIGFSGDPYQTWNWFYTALSWGDAGNIKSFDHELRLQYFRGRWNWLAGLQQGDLNINFARTLRNGKDSANSQHQAIITGLGYTGQRLYWQIERVLHQYQKDLSPLATNRFLSRIIEPSALQQSSTLNKSASYFTLGFNSIHYTINSQLIRLQSALTGEKRNFLSLSFTLPVSTKQRLGFHFITPLETTSRSIGISLFSQW